MSQDMNLSRGGGDALAAPFVGFVIGTMLFGITLLQTYQYFLRYPNDSKFNRLKVVAIFALDLLHFVFSANLMYTFLILNFGVAEASTKNVWSLKALATTQAVLIVFVQSLYLQQIHKISNIPVLKGRAFSRLINSIIGLIVPSALAIAIICCYQLQNVKVILSLAPDFAWTVYLAFSSSAIIDIAITSMMCFVLHRHRIDVGVDVSQQFNRVVLGLIRYALATGLLTAFASIMVIVLFAAAPNSLTYIAVMFSVTRLYSNSVLALLNGRKQHNPDFQLDSQDLAPLTTIVFGGPVASPSIRSRSRRNASNLSVDIIPDPNQNSWLPGTSVDSDSKLECDIEARGGDVHEKVDLFSPYYSPLENRKQMGALFQVREPEEFKGMGFFDFWKAQRQTWFSWSVDRRSTL